jgi:hypothetical protein
MQAPVTNNPLDNFWTLTTDDALKANFLFFKRTLNNGG